MKIFETNVNGQNFGYRVGVNNVTKIVKAGSDVRVTFDLPEIGKATAVYDLSQLPFYVIG